MLNINRITLLGHVTSDVVPIGQGFKFTVATNENYKDKEGVWQQTAEFHTVKTFVPRWIDFIKNEQIQKGTLIFLEGKLKRNRWTGSDGKIFSDFEVVLENFNGLLIVLKNSLRVKQEDEKSMLFKDTTLNDDIPF